MNLNFKPQFVDKILSGQKIHTLRYGERWKVGDRIHFYTGLRTKEARLFAMGEVKNIYASFDWQPEYERFEIHPIVEHSYVKCVLGGQEIPGKEEFWNLLSQNDGFKDFGEMKDFFKKNGKEGKYQMIEWKLEEAIKVES